MKKNYPYCILLLLSFTHISTSVIEADKYADIVVESYIESINLYCQKYDASQKFYIENNLLSDPNINIGSDLSGIEERLTQANYYYFMLKNNKVVVQYKPEYQIETCNFKGRSVTGCIVSKKLIYQDGKIEQRKEFIELSKNGNAWKITGIASDLFYNLSEFECAKKTAYSTSDCPLLDKAEKEYANKNFSTALTLYTKALSCTKQTAYIKNKINELNTIQNIKNIIQQADLYFERKEYKTSLYNYNGALEHSEVIEPSELSRIGKQIALCRSEIDFQLFIEDADFYFKQELYDKALALYEEALLIKPNDNELKIQKSKCEALLKAQAIEKINQSIERATTLILNKKYNEGFEILLKYRDSGQLQGIHLFYMAQILDTTPISIRKKFNFSLKDCCVLTKQFTIEARNLGMNSPDFERFWWDHLNQKSRSCTN